MAMNKTEKRYVEKKLETYNLYRLTMAYEELPKTTQSFQFVPAHTGARSFFSTTEQTALKNIEAAQKRKNYMTMIEQCVNRLPPAERELIVRRYLQEADRFDYQVYMDMLISERQYYRIKNRAFTKLHYLFSVWEEEQGELEGI
ncbi:hypothetical protein CHH77_20200 [Shouchella clausii]|nr:ArpU family transcriptional regulator [Shouchella clausii]PAD14794.1 hypothetical protein CHH73_17045 [Shouchella clausii]PAE79440.1 hypothetical protein CHH77_20200 [Shouchella clausii]PAE88014.1 hypothetical protein CHH72_15605 [Shouchella clausii]PAF07893.1 hypothetical protein CHH65_18610 [Shouchella clausii]